VESSDKSGDGSFDVVILGGGATGLGCAVDAASRGYRTLLLEARNFGCGTSSRSTKLFHGGVRYLPQMRFGLIREALAERATLLRLAPMLVKPLGIIIPVRSVAEFAYYTVGMKLYDALAGKNTLEPSRPLSAARTFELLPTLRRERASGGIRYVDAQFDDRGFVAGLAQTARRLGARLLEHAPAEKLLIVNDRVSGVVSPAGIFSARAVVNATGVWSDTVRRLSDPAAASRIEASRGSHILLDAAVLGGTDGMLIPKTDDGRIIFALPFKGQTLVGTTDIPVTEIADDPHATEEEIDYLLEHARRYLTASLTRNDVRGAYAGLRPLVRTAAKNTAALSREHLVEVDEHGLVSILGGKWTTYRVMARDAIDAAARVAELPRVPSKTEDLPLAAAT